MRWITLLGRTGTVILMVGLALVLVSVPPTGSPSQSSSSGSMPAEEYKIAHSGVYRSQTGFQISVESTDNVHVYLLGLSPLELENWRTQVREAYPDLDDMWIKIFTVPLVFVREAYPDLDDPQIEDIMDIVWNISVLDKGLRTHPEIVLWQSPPSSALSHEFFPADVLTVSVIVANPSSGNVTVRTNIKDLAALAPKERVILPAVLLISIGVALAIPWLVLRKVKKSTL
ncbi:MAG: hypothetical protein OEV52_04385 [Dehalococcoidia bacterium]|nr:hypothetical protein [Dehalococcoidia bacterium]